MARNTKPQQVEKAAQADAASYEVLSPLNHDGEDYAIGEQVELTEAQAAPLLDHTVKPVTAPPDPAA